MQGAPQCSSKPSPGNWSIPKVDIHNYIQRQAYPKSKVQETRPKCMGFNSTQHQKERNILASTLPTSGEITLFCDHITLAPGTVMTPTHTHKKTNTEQSNSVVVLALGTRMAQTLDPVRRQSNGLPGCLNHRRLLIQSEQRVANASCCFVRCPPFLFVSQSTCFDRLLVKKNKTKKTKLLLCTPIVCLDDRLSFRLRSVNNRLGPGR